MAHLTVRKIDAGIVRRLKLRAAQHGRSAEAEHRATLERLFGSGADDFWAKPPGCAHAPVVGPIPTGPT